MKAFKTNPLLSL